MQPMCTVWGPRTQPRDKFKARCWLAGTCDQISQEILEEAPLGRSMVKRSIEILLTEENVQEGKIRTEVREQ